MAHVIPRPITTTWSMSQNNPDRSMGRLGTWGGGSRTDVAYRVYPGMHGKSLDVNESRAHGGERRSVRIHGRGFQWALGRHSFPHRCIRAYIRQPRPLRCRQSPAVELIGVGSGLSDVVTCMEGIPGPSVIGPRHQGTSFADHAAARRGALVSPQRNVPRESDCRWTSGIGKGKVKRAGGIMDAGWRLSRHRVGSDGYVCMQRKKAQPRQCGGPGRDDTVYPHESWGPAVHLSMMPGVLLHVGIPIAVSQAEARTERLSGSAYRAAGSLPMRPGPCTAWSQQGGCPSATGSAPLPGTMAGCRIST